MTQTLKSNCSYLQDLRSKSALLWVNKAFRCNEIFLDKILDA